MTSSSGRPTRAPGRPTSVSERFTLDERGQLTPDDSKGRQALAGNRGQYVVNRTSPDLLTFLRVPPVGGSVGPPRVVLAGDAAGFPLSDLVAFLGQCRWTGMLRVHAPNGERAVLIKDGEVRGATSDASAERIGEVLVRLGYVTRAQLDETLHETPPSKVGRALVEKGLLQSHDLFKCLTEQVSEVFHAIMLCKEGAFVLVDQELDDRTVHTLNLSMQSLLMDSIRKIDEMALFRKRIPHGRMVVTQKRASDGKLESDEDLVLASIDGERTVLELGQAARLSEFDVTRVVYRLLEGHYAAVHEKAAPTPKGAAPARASQVPVGRDPRAVIRIFNFIYREIRDEVAKQKVEAPFLAAANAALAGQALSPSPVLSTLHFEVDGSLPERKLLEQYERVRGQLGSEPQASLRQALSDVMFFLLCQAGELLESRADEDLARRVKELLSTLEAD